MHMPDYKGLESREEVVADYTAVGLLYCHQLVFYCHQLAMPILQIWLYFWQSCVHGW
jgi:hypothetical protein